MEPFFMAPEVRYVDPPSRHRSGPEAASQLPILIDQRLTIDGRTPEQAAVAGVGPLWPAVSRRRTS